jgi:uroporphyrinogen decarboxylase
MTSRERVLTALQHKEPDKIPLYINYGINEYARRQLSEYLGMSMAELNKWIFSKSDIVSLSPRYTGPSYRGRPGQPDVWGVTRKPVNNGFDVYQEIFNPPLKGLGESVQLEDHEFPSPDWYNYASLNETIEKIDPHGDAALALLSGNIFENSWYMVGFEEFLTLMITEPEIIYQLLERTTDFFCAYAERCLETVKGRIDIAVTAGDIGQQDGLLISMPLWKDLVKPHYVRLNKILHSFGVKIWYHTDGAVMDALDSLIDIGIDILNPLQFDAKGMNPDILKEKYGDKLCFHGGVSVQSTLPFGTSNEVREEVRQRIKVLGKGGGYILGPSHAIQGGTPPENIMAFLEEAGRI